MPAVSPIWARSRAIRPTAANARTYALIVRERALLRRLIEAGREIASSVFSEEGLSARELVDHAEQLVFEIAEQGARGREGAGARQHAAAAADRQDR